VDRRGGLFQRAGLRFGAIGQIIRGHQDFGPSRC
jgi:hypothetical protein